MSKIAPRSASMQACSASGDESVVSLVRRGKNRKRTAAEIEHQGRVAKLGCVVCRHRGEAQEGRTVIHHVRMGRLRADCHFDVLPLCEKDHAGKHGVHGDKSRLRAISRSEQELLKSVQKLLESSE